jgi:ElaB/YqjD/DUF883 family membrane-anchored ribosome-binding protein
MMSKEDREKKRETIATHRVAGAPDLHVCFTIATVEELLEDADAADVEREALQERIKELEEKADEAVRRAIGACVEIAKNGKAPTESGDSYVGRIIVAGLTAGRTFLEGGKPDGE